MHDLWSRTNCSVVTASFSQFNMVALSILPRLADAHAVKANNKATCFIFIFYIIIHLRSGGNSFYNVKKRGRRTMAVSVQNFIKLANFYNQMVTTMSAICVEKGGIAMENYVGRFFVADTLEYIVEYARRLTEAGPVPDDVANVIKIFQERFESVKDLVTPTEKPIYEMTLEEFEKIMNI